MAITKEQLKNDLMTALGCTKETSIVPRLKYIDKLDVCSRCGGCGQYSYCQTYGTRCFKCSGSGKIVPKYTQKLIKSVRELWTAEKAAEYSAHIQNINQSKKMVTEATRVFFDLEIHRFNYLAAFVTGSSYWMATSDYLKENYPGVNETQLAVGKLYDQLQKVLGPVNTANGMEYSKEAKGYVACDWQKYAALVAPIVAEMKALDYGPDKV